MPTYVQLPNRQTQQSKNRRTDPFPSAPKPRHRNHGRPQISRNLIHHKHYAHFRTARGNYPHHKFTAPVNAEHGRITATTYDAHAPLLRADRPQRVLLVPQVLRQHCAQRPHVRQPLTGHQKDTTYKNPMRGSTKNKPE